MKKSGIASMGGFAMLLTFGGCHEQPAPSPTAAPTIAPVSGAVLGQATEHTGYILLSDPVTNKPVTRRVIRGGQRLKWINDPNDHNAFQIHFFEDDPYNGSPCMEGTTQNWFKGKPGRPAKCTVNQKTAQDTGKLFGYEILPDRGVDQKPNAVAPGVRPISCDGCVYVYDDDN